MTIMTDGPLLEPESKGIDEFHVGLGARLGATAAQTWEDSPVHQLAGIAEMDRAGGFDPDFGDIASGIPTGPQLADAAKSATARMDIIEANDRVKRAGLAPHLKLPDQPDIAPAQLQIMMDRARRRLELDATIERGPQGFIPGALDVGTSFLVGAVDPLNLASAFVPVMGELRYGKLLADAGSSAVSRAAVRAGVGAAQGAAGQALLEPLDWYSHTQDGRDFGMSDVLHNILFGAALGGGLQAGGGAIADVYRSRKGRAVYPYGPGEPLEHVPQRVAVGRELAPPEASAAPAGRAAMIPEGPNADLEKELLRLDQEKVQAEKDRVAADERGALDYEIYEGHLETIRQEQDEIHAELQKRYSAPPSPEVQTINDLPPQAHEDAMRGAISDLISGVPVRSGELLEAAARADPRIAESFDRARQPQWLSPQALRQAVEDDIRQKLLEAGLPPEQAEANAALTAARYHARAARLGSGQSALDLYHGENLAVRRGDAQAAEAGRTLNQPAERDLFAAREAEGQQSLPGTEPIGQGELAQRRADQPLEEPRIQEQRVRRYAGAEIVLPVAATGTAVLFRSRSRAHLRQAGQGHPRAMARHPEEFSRRQD